MLYKGYTPSVIGLGLGLSSVVLYFLASLFGQCYRDGNIKNSVLRP